MSTVTTKTLTPPIERFVCQQHHDCLQINLHHISFSGYVAMPFFDRQRWWTKAGATSQQRFELYLAEGFPPLGVGKLPEVMG